MKPRQEEEIYQETSSLRLRSRHKSYRSIRTSEDESEGYETMTVTSSAAVSMVTYINNQSNLHLIISTKEFIICSFIISKRYSKLM